MNAFTKSLLGATLLASAALAAPAHAIPLNENFGTQGTTSNLSATFTPGSGGTGLFYASAINSGDFYTISSLLATTAPAGAYGQQLFFTNALRALSPGNGATGGTVGAFEIDWGAGYKFVATSGIYTAGNTVGLIAAGAGSQNINVTYVGTFSDTTNTTAFDTQLAVVQENFGQSFTGGNGSAISYSATFSTSPAVAVAEPMSMAMLGMGVIGLIAVRRRAKAI